MHMKSATSWMRVWGVLMMVGAIVSEAWTYEETKVDGITWRFTILNGEVSLERFTKKCSRPKTPINKLRLFRGFANAPPFQSFENRSVGGESEPSELISILDWPHYFVNRSST